MNKKLKKLMNEQLPAPIIASKDDPRDRVKRHMLEALAAGASLLLSSCSPSGPPTPGGPPGGGTPGPPFGVVDPLPPPANCRTLKADQLVNVNAMTMSTNPRQIRVFVSAISRSDIDWSAATVHRGSLVSQDGNQSYVVAPTPGVTSFDLIIGAACQDYSNGKPFAIGLKVTVEFGGSGPLKTLVTQVDPPVER